MTKQELEALKEEISAQCVAEGYPAYGSTYEIRLEQAVYDALEGEPGEVYEYYINSDEFTRESMAEDDIEPLIDDWD